MGINLKNNEYDFERLRLELIKVRLTLKIYTVLHIFYVIAILSFGYDYLSIVNSVIFLMNFMFIIFFLGFIWLRLPISRYDKVTDTILIILFGIFALWMWIPNIKELKEMIKKYNTTNTS